MPNIKQIQQKKLQMFGTKRINAHTLYGQWLRQRGPETEDTIEFKGDENERPECHSDE